jgi:hypothetical protein
MWSLRLFIVILKRFKVVLKDFLVTNSLILWMNIKQRSLIILHWLYPTLCNLFMYFGLMFDYCDVFYIHYIRISCT